MERNSTFAKALSSTKTVSKMSTALRNEKKRYATAFRNQINQYVYLKGDGTGPQAWPLIRRVVYKGPWAVLSTGAQLVDLPGEMELVNN